MDYGEQLALNHKYDKDLGLTLSEDPNQKGFHYFNAKRINVIEDDDDDPDVPDMAKFLSAHDRPSSDNRYRPGYSRMELRSNEHFSSIPVNTNMSAVHLPANVYDGGQFNYFKH